jgi:hypothetical protein
VQQQGGGEDCSEDDESASDSSGEEYEHAPKRQCRQGSEHCYAAA